MMATGCEFSPPPCSQGCGLRSRWRADGCCGFARVRTLGLLGGFAGNGRRFCHGSGLLGSFWRVLCGVESADLGKCWHCAAFRAEFLCIITDYF